MEISVAARIREGSLGRYQHVMANRQSALARALDDLAGDAETEEGGSPEGT